MLRRMSARSLVVLAALSLGCAVPKDSGEDLVSPDGGGIHADVGSFDAPVDTPAIDPDAACAKSTETATVTPASLYVMFDKSSSMGPTVTSTKWVGARKGMEAFVKDGSSTGLRVALNFFPRPVDATPVCESAAYMAPRVPYDFLPANAAPILAAIDAEKPDGFGTPMYPALGGALRKAMDDLKTRPGEAGAVLLVTDGTPEGPATSCAGVNPEDPAVIAALAAKAVAEFGIKTFVVGLPGVNVGIANQIAAAGGTTAAVLAIPTSTKPIEESFREALAAVRGKALSCDLALPTSVIKGEVSFGLVNVLYSKGGAPPAQTLSQDPTCASGEGWRYDDPSKPTKILLCPKTCEAVRGDPKAKVEILLGCKTAIK
ncbi:MAG: VWA domain-containing protein [Deltaproteobacteria bacterium]|nr:VWA domain-containing protein [Deltaproteobacteria bacterium]